MNLPFHLSLPVSSLEETISFYSTIFTCEVSDRHKTWCNLNFYGNQLTVHEAEEQNFAPLLEFIHFGADVDLREFEAIFGRAQKLGARFKLEPTESTAAKGRRKKMILADPSGYDVEVKCYF